jgi:hypothetical protein
VFSSLSNYQYICTDSRRIREGGSNVKAAVYNKWGWPETWQEWRKVMPLLAIRHTLIAVDLPGFGEYQIASLGYDKKALSEEMFLLG